MDWQFTHGRGKDHEYSSLMHTQQMEEGILQHTFFVMIYLRLKLAPRRPLRHNQSATCLHSPGSRFTQGAASSSYLDPRGQQGQR